jgi:hypothetical protein
MKMKRIKAARTAQPLAKGQAPDPERGINAGYLRLLWAILKPRC